MEWWMGTGTIHHICADKGCSHPTFQLMVRNCSWKAFEFKGWRIRQSDIEDDIGKEPNLNNVLHMLNIHKNLVSGFLLSKNSFKLFFVSDKFMLTKNNRYVSKEYVKDGLFKMNVLTIVPKNSRNKISFVAYILESSNLCKC